MAALYNEKVSETRVQDLPRWSNEWENDMQFRISSRMFKKVLNSRRRRTVTRIVDDIVSSKKSPGYSERVTNNMCALYATLMKNANGEVIKITTPTAKSIEGYPELVCYADGVYQRNGETRLVLFRKTMKHTIEDYVNMPSCSLTRSEAGNYQIKSVNEVWYELAALFEANPDVQRCDYVIVRGSAEILHVVEVQNEEIARIIGNFNEKKRELRKFYCAAILPKLADSSNVPRDLCLSMSRKRMSRILGVKGNNTSPSPPV